MSGGQTTESGGKILRQGRFSKASVRKIGRLHRWCICMRTFRRKVPVQRKVFAVPFSGLEEEVGWPYDPRPSMFRYPKTYDVLVIGAGHAGVEAALAAARLGCEVAVLTQNLDTIGQMSCNPAIGGLGKGHMVREIDALGGIMGINTDATAIQWRMLNASKGPSVRAPRAQCDKKAYQFRIKRELEGMVGLEIHQGNVADILVKGDRVVGITTSLGLEISAKSVILSAGTFMGGLMHVGLRNEKGGRMGDATSQVSEALKRLGFAVERFKTGTPCRINGRSIDFSRCERQDGDEPPPKFSFMADAITRGPVTASTNWSHVSVKVLKINAESGINTIKLR